MVSELKESWKTYLTYRVIALFSKVYDPLSKFQNSQEKSSIEPVIFPNLVLYTQHVDMPSSQFFIPSDCLDKFYSFHGKISKVAKHCPLSRVEGG